MTTSTMLREVHDFQTPAGFCRQQLRTQNSWIRASPTSALLPKTPTSPARPSPPELAMWFCESSG